MLNIAIVLFIIAAIFGFMIARNIFKDKPTPKPAVIAHGSFAVVGVLLVIALTVEHSQPLLITSLVLFIIAALGGLTMLSIDLRKKPIPKLFAIVHPLIAIAGLVTLILYLAQLA